MVVHAYNNLDPLLMLRRPGSIVICYSTKGHVYVPLMRLKHDDFEGKSSSRSW